MDKNAESKENRALETIAVKPTVVWFWRNTTGIGELAALGYSEAYLERNRLAVGFRKYWGIKGNF
ncbi:MAG: hypothetical protein IJ392_05535 [Clostridia bacterium]|nr:hypothetical protein [Clostridia bacterium]